LYKLTRNVFLVFTSLLLTACIDPVAPEFELREGLVFVDGIASTAPGASFVSIDISAYEFGFYVINFVEGATVSFRNSNTGDIIHLIEQLDAYVPPADFAAQPGETWELEIVLPDGTNYRSEPEIVLYPVEISNIRAIYDPELQFRESENSFIPGHRISIGFTDPVGTDNNYYWYFKSYEKLVVCEKCRLSMLRDGRCQADLANAGRDPYYDYICESDCWRIRYPENIGVLSDRFIDGIDVRDVEVAQIPLYTIQDIVVEIQQFSLTPAAFKYYEVLKDIVDDNRGLNAPPPAALVGNMVNVNDAEDPVFGRFTAAATSTSSVFIDRTNIPENPIEAYEPINVEEFGEGPPPSTTTAPCTEGRHRTAIEPTGWIDQ